MEKIKFKVSKFSVITQFTLGALAIILLIQSKGLSPEWLLSLIVLLLALHLMDESEISSIKKYLNEQRRKNGKN